MGLMSIAAIHAHRVQIDLRELGDDLVEAVRFFELFDLFLELETLEILRMFSEKLISAD